MWTPLTSEDPLPESFHSLASDAEADALATLLAAHRERVDPWPVEQLAEVDREPDYRWRWEATTVLVTGTLTLGTADPVGPDLDPMLDTLIHVAFARDELAQLVRLAILVGAGKPWPPPAPGSDWPALGVGCLMDIRSAGSRLAAHVSAGRRAEAAIEFTDADGITSLSPTSGTSGDSVAILGTFPVKARSVLFPSAGGGTAFAEVITWSTNRIHVLAPEPVGEGPVGFAPDSGISQQGIDPAASVDFADALSGCLGAAIGPVAGRLSGVVPGGLGNPRRDVPRLPGDVNVFHGGPILVESSPTSGTEAGGAIAVRGRNLAPGDAVAIEGLPVPTKFVNATTLNFTPPAIASGNKLLQIRRGYRRSNGLPFDVRASLRKISPPGRVTPGTYAELKGTGFGSNITARVDGALTSVSVYDTHTLEVRVRRPARPPADTDRRGEPVTVEVFDRGASLGSVRVTLDTLRIASFGDSVVWGQGLPESEKFTMLVADKLSARFNGSIAVFATDRCAHSGARIVPVAGDAPDPMAPRLPGDFTGECPSPVPSIAAQVAGWASGSLAAQRSEIDLVIISGGANDVRITTIMNALASDTALSATTTAACFTGMSAVLTTVLATFPSAAVVVTGYYPIVSSESDMSFLFPLVGALGLLGTMAVPLVPGAGPIGFGPLETALIHAWVRSRLISRSALFASVANTSLAAAAAAAGPRVAMAIPAFAPANAIFAPDAFVFGVGLSAAGLVPLDPAAGGRVAACLPSNPITTVASIGHPNAKGARAYADAIDAVLPTLGL